MKNAQNKNSMFFYIRIKLFIKVFKKCNTVFILFFLENQKLKYYPYTTILNLCNI